LDDQRFDRLTRKLGAGTSRRQLLKLLAGGLAGGVTGAFSRQAIADAQSTELSGPGISCTSDTVCQSAAASLGPCAIGVCEGESEILGVQLPGECRFYGRSPSTMCRPSSGPCDRAEFCTGSSAACPPNTFLPPNTICLPAPGPCAGDAFCTGSSPFCTGTPLRPAGTICRAATGPCEADATCTGSSVQCPSNELLTTDTVCREAAGDCDVAEVCTGTSAQCPDDRFAPVGTQCGSDGDVCNGQETCDGSGNCVAGAPLICPEDDNPCTMAACDSAGGCVQIPVADDTTCNGTGTCVAGQCMACRRNEEVCNGQCRKKSSYNGDDRNCGACGRVCPDTHVCKGGFCRLL